MLHVPAKHADEGVVLSTLHGVRARIEPENDVTSVSGLCGKLFTCNGKSGSRRGSKLYYHVKVVRT